MNPAEAPTFVYIDYGASPNIQIEWRYSLATLLAEVSAPRVVVYTDQPRLYASLHPCVTPRALDLPAWTRGGAYNHRVKPCALRDALAAYGGLCVLLDTDSWIEAGFAKALRSGAMDQFEARDPYPEIVGFRTTLPHAGAYVYAPESALMYNSGLIAADDARLLEDAIALIDALWEAGHRLFKIEQIAVSEAFRVHGVALSATRPAFQHYFRRSLKRYMHWRLRGWAKRPLAPTRPCIAYPRDAVRLFNLADRLLGRRLSGDRRD